MRGSGAEVISAWGVEHGTPVSKSLVGYGAGGAKFKRAVDVGAKGLREARERLTGPGSRDEPHEIRRTLESRKKGIYARRHDPEAQKTKDVLNMQREYLGSLTGTDLSKMPKEKLQFVGTRDGDYPNAHPAKWGSKKGGRVTVIADPKFRKPKIIEHELMHAQQSSWRGAQIGKDPMKMLREEARADTVSGTYRRLYLGRMRSHTEVNRKAANSRVLNQGGAWLSRKGGVAGTLGDAMKGHADGAKNFTRVQDRIVGGNKKYENPDRAVRRNKAIRGAVYGVPTAAGVGALAYDDRKVKRDRSGKFAR